MSGFGSNVMCCFGSKVVYPGKVIQVVDHMGQESPVLEWLQDKP